VRLIG